MGASSWIPFLDIRPVVINLAPPAEVLPFFERAGWYPGRCANDRVPTPTSQGIAGSPQSSVSRAGGGPDAARVWGRSHPAERILASFAGLVVRPESSTGVECAAGDIAFREVDVRDPIVAEWSALLQTQLVGVAECHSEYEVLVVGADERCFGFSYIDSAFYFFGSSFARTATAILRGYRARPMLLPNQVSAMLYGEVFMRGNPEIYNHEA
jgi:hypothetical protein